MLIFFFLIISPKNIYETKQTVNLSKYEFKSIRVFENYVRKTKTIFSVKIS